MKQTNNTITIAIDAMGGDHAPAEIVKGACQGAHKYNVKVILVGDENAIRKYIPKHLQSSSLIEVVHATEVITMNDHAGAVRTKTNASLVVATQLVKDGKADALINFGNTKATIAVTTLKWGRIGDVDRPSIATIWPGKNGPVVLLDAGAIVDCTPKQLFDFAIMANAYARNVLGIKTPRIAALSIGSEDSKVNGLVKGFDELIAGREDLNYIGHIEGNNILDGSADVIVCDGFVGNVALKVAEGLVERLTELFKQGLKKHPYAYLFLLGLLPLLVRVKKQLDYKEYGGAPVLGLNYFCLIGHGRGKAKAMKSAIFTAKKAVENGVVEKIRCAFTDALISTAS